MSNKETEKIDRTSPIKTIFMGTPEFAVPGLRALLADPDFSIIGVFTQPDRAAGRGQALKQSPIKRLALEYNLKIFQPEKIKESLATIKELAPDLIVVIAYGQIIPLEILTQPQFGGVNVHASLLPRYRGAACLAAALKNGDRQTGVTIMKMEVGLDTGPIIRQSVIELRGDETLAELHDRLASLGAALLPETLKEYLSGKLIPQIQKEEEEASYVPTLKKEDGKIDWRKPAVEIERLVRAYNPWPGTYSTASGETIKIIAVDHEIIAKNGRQPGTVFIHRKKLAVQCGQDSLLILKLQASGKKILASEDFQRGRQLEAFDL